MQPLSGPAAPRSGTDAATTRQPDEPHLSFEAESPSLSSAQRTTLERIIVRITSLSQTTPAEIWAGLHHEVGLKNETELLSYQFPAARQYLSERLTLAENSHTTRFLMQQLSELLPQGNNRQAVSVFIRQQFGQTVLSSLTQKQLSQVLTLLQNGQLAIPQPQRNNISDRTLLPAEHQSLHQQVTKLAALTGESPSGLWASLLQLANLKNGDPIPLRYFTLFTHYLQVRQTLSQQSTATLTLLETALKQPLTSHEKQMLETYIAQHFQATPLTALTMVQAQDMLDMLFSHRAEQQQTVRQAGVGELIHFPLYGYFATIMQQLPARPGIPLIIILLLAMVLWFLL